MNSAKLYTHPTKTGFIIGTSTGNFEVTNDFIANTTISTHGLTEVSWDLEIQNMVDNAKTNADNILMKSEIGILQLLVNEKIEDFDGATS